MQREKTVPNGGYGWKVAFAAAFVNVFNQSIFSIYGLLYGNRILQMGYGAASVALVMSINTSAGNFTGLFTGPIFKAFSHRTIMIIAVFMASLGMVISSFAAGLTLIVLGYGIVTGIGLGLTQSTNFVAVKSYFTTNSLDAVAISVTGTSLGQIIMPHFVNFLIQKYGYEGATLILGGTCLQGLLATIYFDPVENHMVKLSAEERDLLDENNHASHKSQNSSLRREVERLGRAESNFSDKQGKSVSSSDITKPELDCLRVVDMSIDRMEKISTDNEQIETSTNKKDGSNCLSRIVKTFDLDILKDYVFLNVIFGTSLMFTCHATFSSFFPLSLEEDANFETSQVADCLTIMSVSDIIGRLTIGRISRSLELSSRLTFTIGMICAGVSRSVLILQTSLPIIYVLSACSGFSKAITVTTANLVVADCTTQGKTPAAVGINMVSKAIFIFAFGEILALLREAFGSYSFPILMVNVSTIFVLLSWSAEYLYKKRKHVDIDSGIEI